MSDSRLSVRALLLLFLLAAGLRLLPAGYGLPHGFYYDEHRYLSKAVRIGVEGLRPERYDYGPLFPYALAGGLGVVYGVGYGTKSWSSLTEFQDLYFRDPSLFLLTGRVLSALAGTVAVILLVAGARHWLRKPQRPGLGELDVLLGPMGPGVRLGPWLAGAGLAVFSAAVAFGAQGKAEALALLLITFWLYCAGRYHRGSSTLILGLGGVFLGLSIAAKYNALLFFPFHIVLPLVGMRFRKAGVWLTALVSPILGFMMGAPYAVLDYSQVLDGFHFNTLISSNREDAAAVWSSLGAFFFGGFDSGLGPILGALTAVGATALIWRGGRGGIWLVAVAAVYLAANLYANPGRLVSRYLLPGVPVFLLLAGAGLDLLVRPVAGKLGAPPRWLQFATIAFLIAPTLTATLAWEAQFLREDTRMAARRWIETEIPPETVVLLEDPVGSPPLDPSADSVARDPRGARRAGALASQTLRPYRVCWLPVPWGMASPEEAQAAATWGRVLPGFDERDLRKLNLDYWRTAKVEFVVVSSFVYQRHFGGGEDAIPEYRDFYEQLFAEGELIHREDPATGNRPGPTISIYRLPRETEETPGG